ncbi:DUF4037 domain-containing protein [Paenibacillus nasutitermitis]|uniref:DUF4037 domain-containing protein n=1 Tax=Paenibacillus nasutitermitis TaxID=1652958 RepID=A0A917DPH8_9BACL|nr:DUF4037 domain-containing protein [Paenibacillus nasutitermitis]GGD58603.1 hypothetical protein GCM10010911_15530 [Paenibacillus nasutitermitis]
MSDNISGVQLSQWFYEYYIVPRLSSIMPTLSYAAALVGPGSEVLGFDTPMSRDHDWGPRVLIFVHEADISQREAIFAALHKAAPATFNGFPLNVDQTIVATVPAYFGRRLGLSPSRLLEGLDLLDWLTIPAQRLAELTGGIVYRDDFGELTVVREHLSFYPQDVWLFLMASVWNRIGQEEHLMPRAGFVGDELGAALIASRLIRDVMSLCFLIERSYAPYPKWFGTAFRQLACADELMPYLEAAQNAKEWRGREQALSTTYQIVAQMHNELQLTEPIEVRVNHFFDRPFSVIGGNRFADALVSKIEDSSLRKLAAFNFGGIDQISDNTDFRAIQERFQSPSGETNPLRAFFDRLL